MNMINDTISKIRYNICLKKQLKSFNVQDSFFIAHWRLKSHE